MLNSLLAGLCRVVEENVIADTHLRTSTVTLSVHGSTNSTPHLAVGVAGPQAVYTNIKPFFLSAMLVAITSLSLFQNSLCRHDVRVTE